MRDRDRLNRPKMSDGLGQMTLLTRVDGALGYLFVRCSGLGFLDDPATRRYKASLLVATWIMTAAFSLIRFFSFWIYSLHDI